MKHYGDITKLSGHDVPIVDIVTGGSPCQDLSVAGKRQGLAGERSGLFMEQIRLIREMRENDRKNRGCTNELIRPQFMVWENVTGALTSNNGNDFHAVLEETAKIADNTAVIPRFANGGGKWTPSGCIMADGWSIAWRVHDAQFWGVPQRRKRISLVADFGGQSAPEILFERIGLSRDIAESEKQGQTTSADTERGIRKTVGTGIDNQAVCYGISAYESNAMKSNNPTSGIYEAETARTLDNNGGNPACNQGGMMILEPPIIEMTSTKNRVINDGISPTLTARMGTGGNQVNAVLSTVAVEGNGSRPSHRGDGYSETDVMYTLNTTEQHAIAYGLDRASFNQGKNAKYDFAVDEEKSATCVSKGPNAVAAFYPQMKAESQCFRADDISNTLVNGTNPGFQNAVITSIVRRLTPLECERLQGFPDNWSDIGDWTDSKGKKHKCADSPRYKALGNSIALPFWEWLAKRIRQQYAADESVTMASLFDGIAGFPLVFSRAGIKPIWASEIEEFCIAVSRCRFPE